MVKMYFYISLCSALLITSAHSGNSTLPGPNNTGNHTSAQASDASKLDSLNITTLNLISEGGILLPNTLPKQNRTELNSLLTLDQELTKTKETSVVPRKGVDNLLADITTNEKDSSHFDGNQTILVPVTLNTTSLPAVLNKSVNKSTDINEPAVLSSNSSTVSKKNTTLIHKKPLILSAEALANSDKHVQSVQLKINTAPSTETMASSQIPSPNKDSIVKVYPSKANNSHPGMIMPIVITILVVPMFAIVGYMVLKRGQEAWKNRHYKRMDFLLDGMYND